MCCLANTPCPGPLTTPDALNLGVRCSEAFGFWLTALVRALLTALHPGVLEEGRLGGLPGLGTDGGSPATFPAAAG